MITDRQFEALARVASIGPKTIRYAAARDVLVNGLTKAHAARCHELRESTVGAAVNTMLGVHTTIPARIALLTDALGDGTPVSINSQRRLPL